MADASSLVVIHVSEGLRLDRTKNRSTPFFPFVKVSTGLFDTHIRAGTRTVREACG